MGESSMKRRARSSASSQDEFGFKRSSTVNYDQVVDRHIDDQRFERQRALRKATAARNGTAGSAAATSASPAATTAANGAIKPVQPSATMDAFMRMVTGKEERTIADRISDPNRPTWEQYKRENADKLDLNDKGEKEMMEYRKKLDAAREKALGGRSSSRSKDKKKKKKRRRRSSDSDSDSSSSSSSSSSEREDSSRRRKKSKKKKKRRKHHRRSDSDEDSRSDAENSDSRRSRHLRKSKKSSSKKKKKRERSSSPVRLSAFFQNAADSDSN